MNKKNNKQIFNPYLPSYEYIPDGEPHIFGDRLYIYGSHDRFGGSDYCENDYVCWSAPVDDLSDWHFEGEIYNRKQHPYREERMLLFAPDVVKGADGRFYLYYSMAHSSRMSVAVCNTPAGHYEYYGDVKTSDGRIYGIDKGDMLQFDPGVFADDDGCVYLYSGFCPNKTEDEHGRIMAGAHVCRLSDDMISNVKVRRINMVAYKDVLKRLVMYRKSMGLMQTDIAEKFGLMQEQYSYIENGGIIISGQILMNFSEIGFDLDELIAGKKYVYHTKDLDKTLANIDTETHRNFALKLLADIIVSKYSGTVSKMRDEDANNMKMLQSLANDWNGFSMTCFVRDKMNTSQIAMAEKLGLGIKKYRDIEKEKIYPDAETLVSLYNMSEYRPTLFMNLQDRKIQIIKSVWCIFPAEDKRKMLNYVSDSMNIL